MQASLDLARVCGFEEQLDGLGQIASRLLDGGPLARDVQFGAQRDVTVALAGQDRSQLSGRLQAAALPVRLK